MTARSNKGFLKNTFDAMVNARARQVSSYVNGALLMLDDETLEAHGYKREELLRRPNSTYPF
ncbi:hypothetical protein [Oricola sp.]|uniref:hypothetical protein n=1 Tax=Oricola sp. TaxID=1979950 RepID=UPI003BAD34A2